MAREWKRTLLRDDDDDDVEVEDVVQYRRPRIEARQYDPDIIESLSGWSDDDEDDSAVVDELLAKIRQGKYKPKTRDHWSLHVAYSLIQNRSK